MKFKIDEKVFLEDVGDLIGGINVHGHINHKDPKRRKPVVSRIGKECGDKLASALWGYLSAYKVEL